MGSLSYLIHYTYVRGNSLSFAEYAVRACLQYHLRTVRFDEYIALSCEAVFTRLTLVNCYGVVIVYRIGRL